MVGPDVIEIHLEELGEHSWIKALLTTASSSFGSGQCRFVARGPEAEHGREDDLFVGATFPVMRPQDLGDPREPNAWAETARERLAELDGEIVARGWRRRGDLGAHWWSISYRRPETPGGER